MSDLLTVVQTFLICSTLFCLAFIILIALPKSKLRSYCLEAMKYLMACGLLLLVVSPIDLLPDVIPVAGFGDDAGYIVAAIASVISARKEREERKLLN